MFVVKLALSSFRALSYTVASINRLGTQLEKKVFVLCRVLLSVVFLFSSRFTLACLWTLCLWFMYDVTVCHQTIYQPISHTARASNGL